MKTAHRRAKLVFAIFLLMTLCFFIGTHMTSPGKLIGGRFDALSGWEPTTKDGNEHFRLDGLALIQYSVGSLSSEEDHRFLNFFDNDNITKFTKEYLDACARRMAAGNAKVFGALLNGSGAYFGGFGSILNTAFNVYLISQDPQVDRTFRLFEVPSRFPYIPLSEFLEDFTAGSSCPLLTNIEAPTATDADRLHWTTLAEPFSVRLVDSVIKFTGGDRAVLPHFGQGFVDFRFFFFDVEKRDGHAKMFAMKSPLVRAFWKPIPFFKALLQLLWRKLTDTDDGYCAVHIRRGDKIWQREMEDIPMDRYLANLTEICGSDTHPNSSSQPQNVFVMHDDAAAYQRLKILADNQFVFLELRDLLEDDEFEAVREQILGGKREGNAGERERHSRELYLSITLAAMADQIICTFTSNLCRFIALIRGDLSVFHSLDTSFWFNTTEWHAI